jgi:hypothetical protein
MHKPHTVIRLIRTTPLTSKTDRAQFSVTIRIILAFAACAAPLIPQQPHKKKMIFCALCDLLALARGGTCMRLHGN